MHACTACEILQALTIFYSDTCYAPPLLSPGQARQGAGLRELCVFYLTGHDQHAAYTT